MPTKKKSNKKAKMKDMSINVGFKEAFSLHIAKATKDQKDLKNKEGN